MERVTQVALAVQVDHFNPSPQAGCHACRGFSSLRCKYRIAGSSAVKRKRAASGEMALRGQCSSPGVECSNMNQFPLRCSEESTEPPHGATTSAEPSGTPSSSAKSKLQGRSHTSLLGFEVQVGSQPSLMCHPHTGALPDLPCVRLS